MLPDVMPNSRLTELIAISIHSHRNRCHRHLRQLKWLITESLASGIAGPVPPTELQGRDILPFLAHNGFTIEPVHLSGQGL
ncbi:MAG: hypothetical protein HOB73_10555 [Planctomycetaceae bacterium]|nr:hypothetical protein [Planctomycetaceae bacterium]